MDIKGLQYFITAAARLNFTSAARECYITQTAMSLHISKMEDELGFKLFNRGKKAVELTEAGKDFYKRALSIIEHYQHSVRKSASISMGMTGVLTVTLPSFFEGLVFMDRFIAFRDKYPGVELNILVKPHSELIAAVKSERADIAVGSPEDMELDSEFIVINLREDPAVLLCSSRHPFASRSIVTAEMLKDVTIVMSGPEGMPQTYKSLKSISFSPGIEKNTVLPVNNMDEMLLMIELERGVGFLPSFVKPRIASMSQGLVCLDCEFGGESVKMTTAAGFLKDNHNPVIGNLIETLL